MLQRYDPLRKVRLTIAIENFDMSDNVKDSLEHKNHKKSFRSARGALMEEIFIWRKIEFLNLYDNFPSTGVCSR